MWDIDNFPGADKVPWQLLIRARFAYEIDAVVASRVVHTLAGVLPRAAAVEFARAATRSVSAASREPVERETAARALIALADFDDWCGTVWPRWPWPWPPVPGPWPDPRGIDIERFGEILDPIVVIAFDRARELVDAVGSPELQKGFSAALDEASASFS